MTEATEQAERLARIEAAIVEIRSDLAEFLAELKAQHQAINARTLSNGVQAASYTVLVTQVTDHEKRLRAIEQLMPALRFVMWVGAALGVSVLALIWAIVVGQVQVIFP